MHCADWHENRTKHAGAGKISRGRYKRGRDGFSDVSPVARVFCGSRIGKAPGVYPRLCDRLSDQQILDIREQGRAPERNLEICPALCVQLRLERLCEPGDARRRRVHLAGVSVCHRREYDHEFSRTKVFRISGVTLC